MANLFKDRPAFYYSAQALLFLYVLLTLRSLPTMQEASGSEKFAAAQHIGMVILNMFFIASKNRAFNFLALIWLVVLPFRNVAEIYSMVSSGTISFWGVLTTLYGSRMLVWYAAVSLLLTKVLIDYYARLKEKNRVSPKNLT